MSDSSEWREPAQSVERSDDHDIEPDTKVISSADVHGFKGIRDDHMKPEHLRLLEIRTKNFGVLCALLGISERQAGELALREWIRRNRNQVTLETWTEARGKAERTNRALMGVQLAVMKAKLSEIMEILPGIQAARRIEALPKLRKLLPTARDLVEETSSKNPREILISISNRITNIDT